MTAAFKDNTAQHRFELEMDGHTAYAEYRREGKKLFIDFVFSPEELRGTGAAGALMKHIVEAAGKEGAEIVPVCPYAVSWMRKQQKPPAP